MGRLFDSPWPILIIIVVALLLFGAPKLPGMARSVGQSLRIFKSEVKQMKGDEKDGGQSGSQSEGQAQSSPPVEGKIIDPTNQQNQGGAAGSAHRAHDDGDTGSNGPSTNRTP